MSIRKIVGTETELRLDCRDCAPDESRELEMCLEYQWPAVLMSEAIEAFGGVGAFNRDTECKVNPSDKSDFDAEPFMVKAEADNKNNSGFFDIILEHLRRFRGQTGEQPDEATKTRELYQRVGLSGGYVPAGFRLYVDGTHPEFSTPECATPLDLLLWEKAGERIVEIGRKRAEQKIGHALTLYKNNSDGHGHSWGAHENYLISQDLFERLTADEDNLDQAIWMTFLVSRLVYTGAGKMGSETNPVLAKNFLLSQRAEFMVKTRGVTTTEDRPLINCRNIPHAGRDFGRRLHVIVGDSNRCDAAIYLKIGMSMIVLMMLEDGFFEKKDPPVFQRPLSALYEINSDLNLKKSFSVSSWYKPKFMMAIDTQMWFVEQALSWHQNICAKQYDRSDILWIPEVLAKMEETLSVLKLKPASLVGKIDWITKQFFIRQVLTSLNRNWSDLKKDPTLELGNRRTELSCYLKGLDMAYHRLDEKSVWAKLKSGGLIEALVNDADIKHACGNPPLSTRAFDRGRYISELKDRITYISWCRIKTEDGLLVDLSNPWRQK